MFEKYKVTHKKGSGEGSTVFYECSLNEASIMCLTYVQSRNVLKITHLILPQQEGNSDNFVTRNEEEYFEVMEKYDLIQLGWIHVRV